VLEQQVQSVEVTLILAASKPEGIHMSVDYRVTDARTKRLIDDESVKLLSLHHAPVPGGMRSLFAFTGVARAGDGMPTMQWIRKTLRGESETPDQSTAHLQSRLNRDFGPLRAPLMVNILAIHSDNRRY
jgi:hypothetical protein